MDQMWIKGFQTERFLFDSYHSRFLYYMPLCRTGGVAVCPNTDLLRGDLSSTMVIAAGSKHACHSPDLSPWVHLGVT